MALTTVADATAATRDVAAPRRPRDIGPATQSRIITGDVLTVLRAQSAGAKFDVVIADPPYNIGNDFGNNGDDMPIDDYVDWSQEWLAECFRLWADNGGARPPAELPAHDGHDILKHPTQKPFSLTRQLLLSRINGDGRALIPFAGSGSECVAAQSLGVQFLGVEINPEFARFARSWLKCTA